MRFLFLDDDNLRHELFADWHQQNELVHARTIEEFDKAVLNEPKFDIVWLDHDLNDFEYQSVDWANMYGPKYLNGCHAAATLTSLPAEKRPDQIIIHSWNPMGAERIERILKNGGYASINVEPFNEKVYFERLELWFKQGKKHPFMDRWPSIFEISQETKR